MISLKLQAECHSPNWPSVKKILKQNLYLFLSMKNKKYIHIKVELLKITDKWPYW